MRLAREPTVPRGVMLLLIALALLWFSGRDFVAARLLTPDEAGGVSRLMHTFARNYAGLFNRRHGRTGTLWEGRYKACLV